MMLRQEPFTVCGGNLTKPPLKRRTEPLEKLQPSKKVKDSFAVDFGQIFGRKSKLWGCAQEFNSDVFDVMAIT
ncbi:hypothetical protein GRJ2_001282100 [Grus japonensis]|uniref:Uncharacterized protein n=1 Tax=Grus japonensis TaxID=30415 RepID=A0ABC9WS62_GRUJA